MTDTLNQLALDAAMKKHTCTEHRPCRIAAAHLVQAYLDALPSEIPGNEDIKIIRDTAGDLDEGLIFSTNRRRGNIGGVISRACDRLEKVFSTKPKLESSEMIGNGKNKDARRKGHSKLVVTRGGVPYADQAQGLRDFHEACKGDPHQPQKDDLDPMAAVHAWDVWLHKTDVEKVDRDAALLHAIGAYLVHCEPKREMGTLEEENMLLRSMICHMQRNPEFDFTEALKAERNSIEDGAAK